MADNYNVFLYKNTILNKKYIEKLKGLNIPYVYIQDNIPEEEVAVLKKEIEEKSKSKVKEVILKHTYNNGNELKELSQTADNIIVNILEEEEVIENIYDIKERSADVYTHSISICVLATLVCSAGRESVCQQSGKQCGCDPWDRSRAYHSGYGQRSDQHAILVRCGTRKRFLLSECRNY